MNAQSTRYAVEPRTGPAAFDGSAATGELLPGPADLLAAALAARLLKNVEPFSWCDLVGDSTSACAASRSSAKNGCESELRAVSVDASFAPQLAPAAGHSA